MASWPDLSPSSLLSMVRTTLLVMVGRRPAIGSYNATPAGLWQAIAASVVFTVLVTLYPGLDSTPGLFFAAILLHVIGIVLLVLMINILLRTLGRPAKLLPFAVPFLWIENLQQLLGGIIQSLVVMTGDQSLLIMILPVAVWTCYWLWRVGRDIVGKGGWVAAGFIGISFMIDVSLLYMLQSRLPAIGG